MSDIVSSSITTPGSPTPDDFYDAAPLEPHLLYQGEIIIDVPIMIMPKPRGWRLLRAYSETPLEEVFRKGENPKSVRVVDANRFAIEWNEAGDGDFVLGRLSKTPAIVLSQTCDVQEKDFIQVAPIFAAETNNPEYLQRLKSGSIFSAFYLKPREPVLSLPSYGDLERMQAVHKSYVKKLDPKQHFRLNGDRVRMLQRALTRYFGRPNSYDVGADRAPESGTYLCVNCFYFEGKATPVVLDMTAEFKNCVVCGGRLWVRQGR